MHESNTEHKISIIVPAYNIEHYVERCIKSIIRQTYFNLEIIIVNDGSKDGTSDILEHIKTMDNRIHVFHKENGGVTSARLKGLEMATGEWIGFVDGDDFVEETMFERLLQNALKYKAEISHCGYKMVFPNRVDYYYNTGRIVQQDKLAGLKDLLEGVFVEPGLCNKLFHKRLLCELLQENKMAMDIKINEDLLMNYWLFKEAKSSVYEDICPYQYIVRKGSAANSFVSGPKLEDPIKVKKIILEDVKGNRELEKVVWANLIRQYINLATMPYGNSKETIQPHKLNAYKELKALRGFVLKQKNFNSKLKIMALWASIWPQSYGWVHRLYSKISGNDKKYGTED